MRQLLLLILFFSLSNTLSAQSIFYPQDTSNISKGTYNVLIAERQLQYASFGGVLTSETNGRQTYPFILEARISPYFILFKGREQQNAFFRRLSVSFEPELQFRILNDASFPIAPPSFKPKLVTNFFLDRLKKNDKNYLFLTLTLAHYSNGQQNSFLNADSTFNTVDGNFSTNYGRIALTYSRYLNRSANKSFGFFNNALFSITASVQKDGSFDQQLLVYDEDLDVANYGRDRVKLRFQLRSGNIRAGRSLLQSYKSPDIYRLDTFYICTDTTLSNGKAALCLNDVAVLQKSSARKIRPKQSWNFLFRYDYTRILDNNILNPVSTEMTVGLSNPNWRSLGFMIKMYRGPDYMNINFQERINYFHAGISMNINKYEVPNTKYIPHVETNDIVYGDGTLVNPYLRAEILSRLESGDININEPFSINDNPLPTGISKSTLQNAEMGKIYHNKNGSEVKNSTLKKNKASGIFNKKGKKVKDN